ncbi:hypothetical protein AB5J52_00180 [Streptomyces sp. R39]|uniref:Uncharacterized protein n=1 Tax=Streptomyces sp. R39 TaxID=3238631 RepID=A0AB39QEB3_9ACTN
MTIHIDSVVGMVILIGGAVGYFVYSSITPPAGGAVSLSKGERVAMALMATLTVVGILSFLIFGAVASSGSASDRPSPTAATPTTQSSAPRQP